MYTNYCLAFFTLILYATIQAQTSTGPQGEVFSVRVVQKGLSDPWEITYGPDGFLWITEAKGYTVSRINPVNGAKTLLLDLTHDRNFSRYDTLSDERDGGKPWPQGGLMGMALHPRLLLGKPFVYLAYLYHFSGADSTGKGSKANYGGYFFKTKLVRYEYDVQTQRLSKPMILCDTIPGSSDHNSGRLLIAPVDGKEYLFYTVGDMGAGQFDNGGRPNHAQEKDVYEGKVLRFNLEPDSDKQTYARWIPNDNPFNKAGRQQNAVWSYGHRNAQGLAYAVIGNTGKIYSSEHGPYSDDEVNIIEKGKNYGHPLVIGLADNNYNGLAASASDRASLPGIWHTTYPTITDERTNAARIGVDTYRDPIYSLYPLSNQFLSSVLTQSRNGSSDPKWKSEAPSSIEVYTASAIPGWQNSLLIPTLKTGKLIRLQLDAQGKTVQGDTITYFKAPMRYRDITLSPDGKKLFIAVDSSSATSGPSEQHTKGSTCRGCILEFTYQHGGVPRTTDQ
jgi:PQQ-dependent dehydrogenase (s-GDH family)